MTNPLCVVGRSCRFSAAHHLPNVPPAHKCHRLHGHSYLVEAEITGPIVEPTGWVLDFSHLDLALRSLVFDVLDHRCLNEIPGLENPTAEALAAWCSKRLASHLHGIDGIRLYSLTVFEGDGGGWARLRWPL